MIHHTCCLVLLTVAAVYTHQIHYISNSRQGLYNVAAELDNLPLVLLDSMGIMPCTESLQLEDELTRTQLNGIINNPVEPVQSFWTIYIAGMGEWNEALSDPSGKYRTIFQCQLNSNNDTVDLNELLILKNHHLKGSSGFLNNTHLGTLVARSMYQDSFVLFNCNDPRMLLSMCPTTLPITRFENSYYSGTRPFVSRLKQIQSFDSNSVQRLFDIPDNMIPSENPAFFSEFQRIASTLEYLQTLGPEELGREEFRAPRHDVLVFGTTELQEIAIRAGFGSEEYGRAQQLLVHNVIPQLIWKFGEAYGSRSLGTIVFLDHVILDSPVLDRRLSNSLHVYIKGPDSAIPFCYSSYEECMEDTSSCTSCGVCEALSFRTGEDKNESSCWKCSCYIGYAGFACQYTDISVPFFTGVMILAALGGGLAVSIYCMFGIKSRKPVGHLRPHIKTN